MRILDYVQADGDGNAQRDYHLYGQCDGKSANGDVDWDRHAGNGDGDGDTEQLDVWLAGTDDDERAVERDGNEYEHRDGEFHGLHG